MKQWLGTNSVKVNKAPSVTLTSVAFIAQLVVYFVCHPHEVVEVVVVVRRGAPGNGRTTRRRISGRCARLCLRVRALWPVLARVGRVAATLDAVALFGTLAGGPLTSLSPAHSARILYVRPALGRRYELAERHRLESAINDQQVVFTWHLSQNMSQVFCASFQLVIMQSQSTAQLH